MSEVSESCPASEVLEGIAVGRLASPEVRDHLARCDACRRSLQRIREDNRFLKGFAIDGALPTAPRATPAAQIEVPGYRIVREVHRGGQGVVYQAVQLSTKRDVAIKVMKQGPFATLGDRARFNREIAALGKLNHPNIVTVHDAGTIAGFQYFVMNYVDGRPLDEAALELGHASTSGAEPVESAARPSRAADAPFQGPPPQVRIAAILQLFLKVCDAVHAAHLRGVIHRDIKPSNIRVDRAGEPYVLDFGLAKSIDALRDSAMTQTGQFVGSLPWASPEQVEGAWSKIDQRTDVYSLGVVLFQLLTGALPFDVGSNLRNAIDSILLSAPPRPSAVATVEGPRIDDELDTLVLKCLSKERERRYQSAAELARDLRRYLAGEPIEAKGESAIYMLRKTLRRYRLRVAVTGAFVVLLGVFGVVMAVLYRRSAHLQQEATQSAGSLTDLLARSNIEQGRMAGMLGNMQQAEQLLWGELLTSRAAANSSVMRVNDPPGPPEAYWALWELYRRYPCLRSLTPQPAAMRSVTLADDGRGLWTVDVDGFVQKLDEAGKRLDSYHVDFSAGRGLPAVDCTGRVVLHYNGKGYALWRRDAGAAPFDLPAMGSAALETVVLSRTGRRVAAVLDGGAIVWNTDPLVEIARFRGADAELTAIAISNDERRLAARDRLGGLHVWEIDTQRPVTAAPATPGPRESLHYTGELLFSPDDRRLADAWAEIAGRIWDLTADPPTAIELSERPGDYRLQSFSLDGRLLAIGDLGGTLRIFDAVTGQRRGALVAQPARVRAVAFTGDGCGVWTCGDSDLRLWEVNADAGVRVVQISGESLHAVDISPDGHTLSSGGGLGKLHRIDRSTLAVSSLAFGNNATISCVASSPDGRRTAVATYGNAVHIWDTPELDGPPVVLAHPNRVSHVCFSPDGARLATACDDGNVRVWRSADGQLERELRSGGDRVPRVAFDDSGRHLAAAVRNGALLVWNLDAGTCETWSAASGKPLRAVCYSPEGRWLIAAGADRVVEIWDVASHRRVAVLVGHNQEIFALDVSATGALIASGDAGGAIRLWDAGLRRPLATLEGHAEAVMSLHFARDGRSLVSASLDGTLRVWDLTYYGRHIAGNVETELRRVGAAEIDATCAAEWRNWAERNGGGQ